MYKKLLMLVLSLCLIVGLVPVAAMAADDAPTSDVSGGVTWKIADGTLTVSAANAQDAEEGYAPGQMKDWDYDKVPNEKAPWYSQSKDIKTIEIEDGVTNIGNYAFRGLSKVTNVSIGKNVEKIGKQVFRGTALTQVTIPENVQMINSYAFQLANNLTKITIQGDGITLEAGAFQQAEKLETLELPASVAEIGEGAIRKCFALTTVTFGGNESTSDGRYIAKEGMLLGDNGAKLLGIFGETAKKDTLTVPEDVTSIGDFVLDGYANITTVELPSNLTDLSPSALAGANLNNITTSSPTADSKFSYDDGVLYQTKNGQKKLLYCVVSKTFDNGAFTVPADVTTIEKNAFSQNKNLTTVNMGEALTTISRDAFADCEKLTTINWGDSKVESIGENAFKNTALTSEKLPTTLKTIGDSAFQNTSLTNVVLSTGVTFIGKNAFADCKSLKTVTLNEKLTSIGDSAFQNTALESVTLPDSVTTVGTQAFDGCNLTYFKAGSQLTSIGERALQFKQTGAQDSILVDLTALSNDVALGKDFLQTGDNGVINGYRQVYVANDDILKKVRETGAYSNVSYIVTQGLALETKQPTGDNELATLAYPNGKYSYEIAELVANPVHKHENTELTESSLDGCVAVARAVPEYSVTLKDPTKTYTYTGSEIKPEILVKYMNGNKELQPVKVEYENNTNAGQAKAKVTVVNGGKVYEVPFIIDKAPLTIKADDQQITVGDPLPEFTYTATVWKGTDDETLLKGLTLTSNGADKDKVGNYTITFNENNKVELKNYDITYVDGTLTVSAPSTGPATYAIAASKADHGTVAVNPTKAVRGKNVTITAKADAGYEVDAVKVTDRNGKSVKVTANSDGTYSFTMPASKVDVSVSFKAASVDPQPQPTPENPFSDVADDAFYHDAVLWAVDNKITNGTSATTFSPNLACTRAQMICFLWNQAGQPAPKGDEMPFTDVAEGTYYHDAVQWAVEQGLAAGTSSTTFSPNVTLTRGQTVTFLYRAAGEPAVNADNSFTDVADGAYYADAVAWAVQNGVTVGTATNTFSPDADCTRGQIVTFLWRAAE